MWYELKKLIEKWACTHDMEFKGISVEDGFFGRYRKYMFKCRKCGKIVWTKSL